MEHRKLEELQRVVFERLVCGESEEDLCAQMSKQLGDADAHELLAEARKRIERGRGDANFVHSVQKIRKRRLAGQYLGWKIIGWIFASFGVVSTLAFFLSGGEVTGWFGGILFGLIILAIVEWREHRRLNAAPNPVGESPTP